ncbi:nucleolar complex protein 14 [Corchorus olitorius]|uniref:Nucleolar complex protein 14 n=1 Tax=Corchorus olitorius TaxID=93759 RepID=A0A1R3L2Y5_9ROSI|nr:nucleolar complex protein 14 [Corchorus olitorius]
MLPRAEIVREQRGIGRDHAHQRYALEVMPLGDHLRADQDVDAAFVHGVEQRFGAALAAGGIGVDAGDAGLRKQLAERLFDALGAAPERRDVDVAAVWAVMRDARFVPAVVAAQAPLRLVQHQVRRAARTARQPAARVAGQHRRVAAAVEEQQALFAARQAIGNRVDKRFGQSIANLAPRAAFQVEVDERHARQHRFGLRALRERQACGGGLLGAPPGFQRRRGGAQHHGNVALLGTP